MKVYLTIFLVAFSVFCYGQEDSLDIWISNIHNRQVKLDLGYIGYSIRLDKESKGAYMIIETGDRSSKKLIDLLTSDDRGIVAHYLLTYIHNKPNDHHLEYEAPGHFCYNGLELESTEKLALTSKKQNLNKCREDWRKRLGE